MPNDPYRLGGPGAPASPLGGALGRALTWVMGALLLAAAFTASIFVFAFLAVAALIAGGWFWWRTRELRKRLREAAAQMREAAEQGQAGPFSGGGHAGPFARGGQAGPSSGGGSAGPFGSGGAGAGRASAGGGRVIEGEVIRDETPRT